MQSTMNIIINKEFVGLQNSVGKSQITWENEKIPTIYHDSKAEDIWIIDSNENCQQLILLKTPGFNEGIKYIHAQKDDPAT